MPESGTSIAQLAARCKYVRTSIGEMGRRTDTRDRMIDAANRSFRSKGMHSTSFSDVIEQAGAARGAIYHHFPGGKDELAIAVVERTGQRVDHALQQLPPGVDGLLAMIDLLADIVDGDPTFGCPISPAVLESPDRPALLSAAAAAYGSWRTSVTRLLVDAAHPTSNDLAALVVASVEGALLLCRADRSSEPLRSVRSALAELLSPTTGSRNEPD